MFEHFTNTAIAVIMKAQEEARRLRHNFVGTEQLLLGILREDSSLSAKILKEMGVNLADARAEVEAIIGRGSSNVPPEIPFTPKVKQIFEHAFQEARKLDSSYVEPEHLLLSLTQNTESVAYRVLSNLGVDPAKVRTQIIRELGEVAAIPTGSSEERRSRGDSRRSRTKILAEFGTDLTERAAMGRIDPVVGRRKEIERVVQILGRRTKNNPVLIGEPGVGKTAIAEGLAQRIVNQDVPEALIDKRVIMLDMGSLVAGTRFRGDFEERLTQIVEEVRRDPNLILVIDELHTLVGAGSLEGGLDAANMFKPALARGEMQCIGATTLDEYRKYIERDAALERRFQPVTVAPPTVPETIEILQGIRSRYEQFHQVSLTDTALEAAAKLSDRYITDRFLPDKAIDLIDEASSQVKLRYLPKYPSKELKQELRQVNKDLAEALQVQDFAKAQELRDRKTALTQQIQPESTVDVGATVEFPIPVVNEENIADIVASWTGIPVNRLTETESVRLIHLEEVLHERVIGQHEAVVAVSRAIRRARVGLSSPDKPIASLVFSGPTGVGKTELAKALAVALFGNEEAMTRLDMSEFMESHTVSKLIGSPPGFVGYDEGGQLTEAVRRNPYTVILLDEIEKAHPDVFNVLLQVLDDGRLSDAKGRTVSFKNTLIIMTSNIGSKVIEKGGGSLGFDLAMTDAATTQYNNIRTLVTEEMKQYFRPEMLNRLDEIIVFRQLSRDEVVQIAELMMAEVNRRLEERAIAVKLTAAFNERLIKDGYDQRYGARPMRRAIARLVEDALAEAILSGRVKDGDTVLLDIDEDGEPVAYPERQPALAAAIR